MVYLNSFNNAFVWDDLNNIVNNKQLEGTVRLTDIFLKSPAPPAQFYRPIPFISIAIDHLLWGKEPFGYHLTNFLLHLFNAIFVFYIVRRITNSDLTSFICSILFAVHPIHTEAVTYISGRSDPICTFFLLVSFYFYIRYTYRNFNIERDCFADARNDKPEVIARSEVTKQSNLVYLITALFLFLLGLFSKEIALVFPFILISYDVLFMSSPLKVRIKRNLPFLLLMMIFLLFRYAFVIWQPVHGGLGKIYFLPGILLSYLKLMVFPFNLHMQHSLQENGFLFYLISAIIAIIFCILAISRIIKDKVMIFGLAWFLIGMMPFLGILKLNADMAEHWLYLASFGFFLMVSCFFVKSGLLNNKFVLPAIILFLGILTIQRNVVWRDDISIYQDTLKYHPDDHKLHYNLGNAYLRRGIYDGAFKEYTTALKQKPDYPYALNNLKIVKENLLNLKIVNSAFADEEIYFDHSLYGEVLARFVKDGNVDYIGLKNNRSILDAYLKKVSELSPGVLNSMPRNEKIAFYLNVYNALTLKVIVENYPVKSIKDIPGVWDKIKFKVATKELTLNNIEHDILRKEFREPRIHFALVCASRSCPELSDNPFSGTDLSEQLNREAHKFINDKTRNRLDRDNKILYLSSIFKWFKEDFGEPIEFVSRYMSKEDVKIIQQGVRVKYLNYDWSLNEK